MYVANNLRVIVFLFCIDSIEGLTLHNGVLTILCII